MPPHRQEKQRQRASDLVDVASGPPARDVAWLVVIREDDGGPSIRTVRGLATIERPRPIAAADHPAWSSSKSKTRWRSALRRAARLAWPSKSSPTVIRPGASSTTSPKLGKKARQVRLILVVDVKLPGPG